MARLLELLDRGADDSPALIEAETGRTYTYGELQDMIAALGRRLAAVDVERGSRVALVIPNGPDFVFLLLAATALGATAAPLNPAYKFDEYAFYLDDLQPDLLLVPEGGLEAARRAIGDRVRIIDVRSGDQAPPELVGVNHETPFPQADSEDVALLLHTSGTTSQPKQVPLLHRNLFASATTIAEHYRLSNEDVSYCAMPLFHVHGLVASTLGALAAGGTVVVPRRFAPRSFWLQARRYGVTWFSAGPTLHSMMLDRIDADGPPSTLRFARSCSSALSPPLMARLEDVLGVPMLEAYGMTEASHQMASNPLPPKPRHPGSVGIATGVEIAIKNGEVVIRGPGVTPGYLNNPDANSESFHDGWFRTGDTGELDEDGYLRLTGRIKEMILRGGENISPYEIEDVLLAHPAVADAVCFGIADEKFGERVGAAVQLSGEATDRDLIAHCRDRLASFKVPETVYLLERIPRTATGKVQRRRMAGHLAGENA